MFIVVLIFINIVIIDPNCTFYLASMPATRPYDPTVPVQAFSFSADSFSFSLNSPEDSLTIGVWVQTKNSNEYVSPLLLLLFNY